MSEEQNQIARRISPRLFRAVQIFMMLLTVFLLGAHILKWDTVRVDAVSLALIGLLIVIPIVELVKKIKLGEFEAEIGRDEVAKVQANAAVDLSARQELAVETSEERIRDLLREDPRLALAKVRIELEEEVKRLYSATADLESNWQRMSLGRLVDGLVRRDVLTSSVAKTLRDVIGLANRAVHGERVELDAAEELAVLGVRLTREIQDIYLERIIRPVSQVVISQKDAESYSTARYRVITIVPLVNNPLKNTYVFDQNALESFLGGYEEHAEFIVSVEQV